MGDTAMPLDALGCPIRLGYDKDGSVKFGKTGRPVTRVAKPISDGVNLIRQNFVATLQQYADDVLTSKEKEFASVVELAHKAGQPIATHDAEQLRIAVKAQLEEAMRASQEATQDPTQEPTPDPDPELVAVG